MDYAGHMSIFGYGGKKEEALRRRFEMLDGKDLCRVTACCLAIKSASGPCKFTVRTFQNGSLWRNLICQRRFQLCLLKRRLAEPGGNESDWFKLHLSANACDWLSWRLAL